MKKKINLLIMLYLVTCLMLCLGVSASAAEVIETGYLNFDLGEGSYVIYEDGTAVISGNGELFEFDDTYNISPFINNEQIINVVFEEGITGLYSNIFIGCYNLETVFLPDSLLFLNMDSFKDSLKLKTITIPKGVQVVNYFYECASLESITVDKENPYFSTDEYGVLYNKNKTALISYPASSDRSDYEIKDGTKTVEANAFNGCKNLESVKIPNSVTEIKFQAFGNCEKITNIKIPDSVKLIDSRGFFKCKSLKEIDFGNGVERLGMESFYECESLTEINIPSNVKEIGGFSFEYCRNLKSVFIPKDVWLYHPSSIFSGCESLIEIKVHEDNPNYASDEKGILYDKAKKCLYIYPAGSADKEYVVSDDIEIIEDYAFYHSKNLEKVTLGKNVKEINYHSFSHCEKLETVTFLGESLELIDTAAFAYSKKLKCLVVPNSVTKIGLSAFDGCVSLQDIVVLNKNCEIYDKDTTLGNNAIIYGYDNSTVHMYAEKYNRQFVSLGEELTCDFSEGVLLIKGNGIILDSEKGVTYPWSQYATETTQIILEDITSVGKNAFANFVNLCSVIIDGKTTTITDDEYMIYEFSNVKIESGAFSGCENLNVVVADANINFADDAISGADRAVKYFINAKAKNDSEISFITFDFADDFVVIGENKIPTFNTIIDGEVSLTEAEFKALVWALYYVSDNNFVNMVFNKLIAEDFYIFECTSFSPLQGKEITEVVGAKIFGIVEIDPDIHEYMEVTMTDLCDALVNEDIGDFEYKFAVLAKGLEIEDEDKEDNGKNEDEPEVEEEPKEEETEPEEPNFITRIFATILESFKKIISLIKKLFS